ncbi:1-acyl-sn-glycerol-3-phosphate acyltransferase [Microbulbifer sp. 2205BS26-8]|uniref:1-acyl-sn-glycerol-3-phosphate acyltransferase n=1 Tax=Microbulbifer sp. 2205BS26-8 TaxID=3064386 RepID=UPI00273DB163|nr:1-acyl-sn-glycerol-3-phosphate acyltransferase [Microbulbifer sp. 2205BS26-8]MDP5210565.1 1-acyl-sn-glycerol-3-phosphate acyltransferase [Microbulbifer sp. 2205BS26-8]
MSPYTWRSTQMASAKFMQKTIFNTPVVTPLMRQIAKLLLKLHGWRVKGNQHSLKLKKYVLLGAPHTTNWDGYFFILAALKLKLTPQWMGKDRLFKFPLGRPMRWFGGIAVNRSKANNLVEATIRQFRLNKELIIAIPPEGTRGMAERWKTGFYHIARNAKVPVVLGFINFRKKEVGIGPIAQLGENLEVELNKLRAFYADKIGKFPEHYAPPCQ